MLMGKRQTLGEKIRAWRRGAGLLQKDVAERARLSQAVWSDLENDKTEGIGLETARRVVAVSGGAISLADFPGSKELKRVRPVEPESSPVLEDASLHSRAS